VHRQIDLAGGQRILDFLDEQPLAADLGQRRLRSRSPEVLITTISQAVSA